MKHALSILLLFAAVHPLHAADADSTGSALSCPQVQFAQDLEPMAGNDIVVEADSATLDRAGLSTLTGSVRLRTGDQLFSAEKLSFDETERVIQIDDESLFRNSRLIVRSQAARFDLSQDSGLFEDTKYTLTERAARGSARKFRFSADGEARMDEVSYTTCAPGDSAWQLEARRIELSQEDGLGTALGAKLRFAGVPIIYLPWFQFPIDDRRRTGLLFPTLGESDRTGVDFRWPIYVNLAPNYDATVTPRMMSSRGLQLGTEFRYLLREHRGDLTYEILPNDREVNRQRSYVDFEHEGLINRRLAVDAHYAEVSDRSYFEDFTGKLDTTAITHLNRRARLTYRAPAAYRIEAMVQDFQTIDPTLTGTDEPYQRLPRVLLEAQTRQTFLGTRAGITGEFVNFALDDAIEGQRLDLVPYLRYLKDETGWYYGARADLRMTRYQLSGTAAGQPAEPDRTLGIFSADGGLRFERRTSGGQLQTLEPQAIYLHVPYENQDDLPVFDSGEPDFDFVQLFARNRFSGVDRVSDANHLALAVGSRLIDPDTGIVRLSAAFGQLYRFEETRVALPGGSTQDNGSTDFIAHLDYRLAEYWLAGFDAQWSPDQKIFNRSSFSLDYSRDRKRLALSYSYRRDLLEQADATLVTPIAGNWHFAGRWRFSLAEHRSLETLAGLEYETCCWSASASWRRHLATASGDYSSGVYVQLQLKGLGGLGSGYRDLLPSPESPQ